MKTKFHSVEARGQQSRWLNIITWCWLQTLRLKRDGGSKNALQRCVCLYPYSICNDLSSLMHVYVWCERSRVIVVIVILFWLEFSFVSLPRSLLKTAEYRYASYLCVRIAEECYCLTKSYQADLHTLPAHECYNEHSYSISQSIRDGCFIFLLPMIRSFITILKRVVLVCTHLIFGRMDFIPIRRVCLYRTFFSLSKYTFLSFWDHVWHTYSW